MAIIGKKNYFHILAICGKNCVSADTPMLAFHMLQPNNAFIGRRADKCLQCCGQRYSHFECNAAVPLKSALLKHAPIFLDIPEKSNQGNSSPVNDSAKILVPFFLSTAQYWQSQVSLWRHN
jgi:hypothetical protein